MVEILVAAIDVETDETLVYASDSVGCTSSYPKGTAIGGAQKTVYPLIESLWKENMSQDELEEVATQIAVNGPERNIFCGQGSELIILTGTKIIKRKIET